MTGLPFWQAITDFGDAALLLPLTALAGLAVWPVVGRDRVLRLLAGVALAAMLLGSAKILFAACGMPWQSPIQSPSGHVGLSVATYGGLAWVLAGRAPMWRILATFVAVVAVPLLIGVSRVVLGAHNVAEVLAGTGIGAMSLFLCFVGSGPPSLSIRLSPFLWRGMAVALALLHGLHFSPEAELQRMSRRSELAQWLCRG